MWKAHMDGCSGALGEPEESCHLGDDWEGPVSWKQTQDKRGCVGVQVTVMYGVLLDKESGYLNLVWHSASHPGLSLGRALPGARLLGGLPPTTLGLST